MESARSNRYHSSENFPPDQEAPNCLAAFLRSSRSPSFQEAKAVGRARAEPAGEEQLRGHYEVIERVLNAENANLKKQAGYLVGEMRKSLRREKGHREQLAHAQALCLRAQQQLAEMQREGREVREFVHSKILLLLNALKLAQLHDLQAELARIAQELC